MTRTYGKLKAEMRKLKATSPAHIEEVFTQWVNLPKSFGRPARSRLFSPLTHLLAVPLPSPLEDAIVQRDPPNVSRMARIRTRTNRFAQHRSLLQSARTALDKRHTGNAQEGGKENRE
jgi:hypothetical protein